MNEARAEPRRLTGSKSAETTNFSSRRRAIDGESEIRVNSVGLDIGSTTHHLLISQLRMSMMEGRYQVTEARSLYASEVGLTPYLSPGTIDARALRRWMRAQFRDAGMQPKEIDGGAVLLTGLASLAGNARSITNELAMTSGILVAASAGHHLEAALAARGSGAVALSGRERSRVLHLDVGGGTIKFATCRDGALTATAAIGLGARLIVVDDRGRIERVEETALRIAERIGVRILAGEALEDSDRDAIVEFIADRVVDVIGTGQLPDEHDLLLLTGRLPGVEDGFDTVTFSGGVSEYIYGREAREFGDLGRPLGAAIRDRIVASGRMRIVELSAGIRATALGATRYMLQLSGQTVFVAPRDLLPLRNVPVARAPTNLLRPEMTRSSVCTEITALLQGGTSLADGAGPVAIALEWQGPATFERIDALGRGLCDALQLDGGSEEPLIVLVDRDVAGIVGIHLAEELGLHRVISIDGIAVDAYGVVDLGDIVEGTGVVPVVVKSLVFPAETPIAVANA